MEWNGVSEIIQNAFRDVAPKDMMITLAILLVIFLIAIAVYALLFFAFLKLNRRIFRRLKEKNGNSITLQFMEKVVALILIVLFVVFPLGGKQIARSLLGSTAVIAVVVGLAANEVLKDMFAGLEISIYKPFDVGSRIKLEDGTAGIVEKMTLRHIVIRLRDTTRLIIPNSKANSLMIVNFSYDDNVPRSIELTFPISYTADIDKAKQIIKETICDCPLTLNKDKYKEEDPNSKSVYFLSMKDSSLVLGATVYYDHDYRTEVITDEVNTSVFKALTEGGIEIPYDYVNVVMKNE